MCPSETLQYIYNISDYIPQIVSYPCDDIVVGNYNISPIFS